LKKYVLQKHIKGFGYLYQTKSSMSPSRMW